MGSPHPGVEAPSSAHELPVLTAREIATFTDSGSYSRGRDYRRREAIRQPARRGRTLSALCHGSEPVPYRVQATLSDPQAPGPKIVSYACTCPRGGFCKHIVALLLTWIENADVFEVLPTTDELLADQSRDDLLRLIRQLVEHDPTLATLIDRLKPPPPIPSAAPGEARVRTINQAAFRRKISQAIQDVSSTHHSGGYYDSYGDYQEDESGYEAAAASFREYVAQGLALLKAGWIADAVTVFATVADEAIDYGDDYAGDDIIDIALDCGLGLLDCLERQATLPEDDRLDSSDRATLVESLFNVWSFAGGWGWGDDEELERGEELEPVEPHLAEDSWRLVADRGGRDAEVAIAAALTDDERACYETWLRELLKSPGRRSAHAKRDAIRFLFKLRPNDPRGEDALLNAYKDAELWEDATSELLSMGRISDAVALASHHLKMPNQTLAFANRLTTLGDDGASRAIRFVADRLWETEGIKPQDDLVFIDWLSRHYANQGMSKQAFEMERRRFKQQPSFRFYASLKEAALRPGLSSDLWDKTRPQLIEELTKRRLWGALIDIYLHEEQVAEAIATLKEMEKPGDRNAQAASGLGLSYWLYAGMGSGHYRATVAKAAERDFPEEAIRLYRTLAEEAISGRNRQSYATAATYLASVRNLMESTGKSDEWLTYITGLREEHKRLRALKEELDALGLQ